MSPAGNVNTCLSWEAYFEIDYAIVLEISSMAFCAHIVLTHGTCAQTSNFKFIGFIFYLKIYCVKFVFFAFGADAL